MKIKVKDKKTNKTESFHFDEEEEKKYSEWRKQQDVNFMKHSAELWLELQSKNH